MRLLINSLELFHKGAEASLYRGEWFGRLAVSKVRHPRKYRHPQLDYKLRISRTAREATIITSAKKAGVNVPILFEIDFPNATIIMQYVEGKLLRDIINDMSQASLKLLFSEVGSSIADLHNKGIVHGDLTTSNMIYTYQNTIYFIDFGLSGVNSETESRGVDLLLAKRTLSSTHPIKFETCFDALLASYIEKIPTGRKVVKKIEEIEGRGRYVERPPTQRT